MNECDRLLDYQKMVLRKALLTEIKTYAGEYGLDGTLKTIRIYKVLVEKVVLKI